MRLLLLQISDIHWRVNRNDIVHRFEKVGNLLPAHFPNELDAIIFLYGGDLVFSGKEDEFDEIGRLLTRLEDSVKGAFGDKPKYYSVGVPGNHDCDFSEDQSARDALLDTFVRRKVPGVPPFQWTRIA